MNASGRKGRGPARTQAERSQSTRETLISAARPLFAERGYAGVGTEEIVRAAGLTRGALYHQFGDKRGLFEAVYETIEHELAQTIGAKALTASDPLEAMRIGMDMLLDACLETEVQRILLTDAPAVLGWERWREIGAEAGLGLIEASLQAAMDAGEIKIQPVHPLAHVVMGALDEAAMLVARSDDPTATRKQVAAALWSMLEGLRP
jgi:AcrR family transcriptional regulator